MPCEHEPKYAKGLCRKCYDRALYAANRRTIIARQLRQRHANPKAKRSWNKANAAKVNESNRRWAAAHPEVRKALNHRRRARIAGNGGSWTPAEWATLKRQYGHRCVGCWKSERELKTLGRKLV